MLNRERNQSFDYEFMGLKVWTVIPLNPLNKLSHEREKRDNWFIGYSRKKPEGKNPNYNIQGVAAELTMLRDTIFLQKLWSEYNVETNR